MPDNKDNSKSIKYWQDRALQRENEYQASGSAAVKHLERIYDLAFDNIEKEIESAVRQLDKKYYMNGEAPDAEAYHARLTRLEGLKRTINDEMKRLAGLEHDFTTNYYTNIIKEGYYKTMFDIQKGLGYGFDFNALPNKLINETLTAGWSGKNYSARIWKNAEHLADKMKEVVQAGILSGMPVRTMVSQLENEAKKNGKFSAERLVRTETNYFANQGELKAYEETGIERYEFLAVLDTRTSEQCQEHDGEINPDTNKPYLVKDAVTGKNFPPLHAFCRSTTVARFDGEVMEGIKRRARDPVTGELMLVDADMNYAEWKEKYTYIISTDNKIKNSGDEYDFNYGKKASNVDWDKLLNISPETSQTLNDIHTDLNAHMINNHTEKIYLLNRSDNADIIKQIGTSIDEVGLSKEVLYALKKGGDNDIIMSHCHPSKTSFSVHDIRKIIEFPSIKSLTVECVDGSKYLMDRGTMKSSLLTKHFFLNKYDSIYRRVAQGYPELNDEKEIHKVWDKFINDVNKNVAEHYGMIYEKVE